MNSLTKSGSAVAETSVEGQLVRKGEKAFRCELCSAEVIGERNMRSIFMYSLGGCLLHDDQTECKFPVAYWCAKCTDEFWARVKAGKERAKQKAIGVER